MAQRDVNSSRKRNFAFCFRPIYYFSRLSSQMPFTIAYRSDDYNDSTVEAKLYKRDFVWFAISLSIHILLIYMEILVMQSQSEKFELGKIHITMIGSALINLIFSLLGIFAMILDAINRFRIIQIFNEITDFDEEVYESR